MNEKSERTVKVAELKARLTAYLRAVRRGHPVTVCERDTPMARLVPYAGRGAADGAGAAPRAARDAAAAAAGPPGRQPGRAARGAAVLAMIAYLDASVVLRLVLGEPNHLAEWPRIEAAVASALAEVECLRTLDRLSRRGSLSDDELAERRTAVYRLFEAVDVVDVGRPVVRRASEPFPTPLGTLDAIHLSTAMAWRDARDATLTMATHDTALARRRARWGWR